MADLLGNNSCTYCEEDISGIRIRCAECTNVDLCLQCFAVGAQIGPHKNDHPYKLVYPSAIKLFGGKSWTGDEELRLLNALFTNGFGRWEVISEIVRTRTPEECKNEYISRYLEGNIGKATWADAAKIRPALVDHVSEGASDPHKMHMPDDGPLSAGAMSRLPALDITPEEEALLEYKPYRDDFNQEYDLEAEQLLANLKEDDNDCSDSEKLLKLKVIDMYQKRFTERVRRKRLLRDYQLVAKYFGRDEKTNSLTETQREFREKMRPFAQFFTHIEYDQLIENIEKMRELRYKLSELYRYRSLGLMTHEEIIHYEQHAEFERQLIKQNQSGSSGCAIPVHQSKNGNESVRSSTDERSMWRQGNERENNYGNNNNTNSSEVLCRDVEYVRKYHLSSGEQRLCTVLNLEPVQYVQLKLIILQEPVMKRRKLEVKCFNTDITNAIKHYLTTTGILKNDKGSS